MSFEKIIFVDRVCLTVLYEKQLFRFTIIDREKIISVLYEPKHLNYNKEFRFENGFFLKLKSLFYK